MLAATLLTGCATDSTPAAPVTGQPVPPALATSPAAGALAKLTKNLTKAQVRELLGAPASTKPIKTGEFEGEIWSYPFRGATEVNVVAVATRDIPAVNPRTGQSITVSEPVYQNQSVEVIDTLHLLLFGERLVEWRVVRDEKKQFQ